LDLLNIETSSEFGNGSSSLVEKFTIKINAIKTIIRPTKDRNNTMSGIAVDNVINDVVGSSDVSIVLTSKSSFVVTNSVSIM
jgi:hypothetical protein